MKKIFSALLVALVLAGMVACHRQASHYTIWGELPVAEFDGANVLLTAMGGGDTLGVATVSEGAFRLEGTVDIVQMARIVARKADDGGMYYYGVLVLEPGEIHINLVNDSLYGTPLNDAYFQSFIHDSVALDLKQRMMPLVGQLQAGEPGKEDTALVMQYVKLDSLLALHNVQHCREVFEQNRDNVLGAYALDRLVEYEELSFEELDSLMQHSGEAIAQSQMLRASHRWLYNIANTSEGKPFVDLEGIEYATGEPTRLSQMLSAEQVTLVDFWASWCGPCRMEISENLNRLYAKYGGKGLNIIGVDVWDKRPDHAKAVADLGIAYPQLIDTTATATTLYGVKGIPTILLLGKDGTILRRGIRGEEIEAAVVEALGL